MRGFWFKYSLWIFGNRKNVSGWKDCSLLRSKCIYCKLTNTLHTSLSKFSNSVLSMQRYSSLLKFPNVPGVSLLNWLPFTVSSANSVSPLNAPNSNVLTPHHSICNLTSSVIKNKTFPLNQRYVAGIKQELCYVIRRHYPLAYRINRLTPNHM